jgi:hypothetical protein
MRSDRQVAARRQLEAVVAEKKRLRWPWRPGVFVAIGTCVALGGGSAVAAAYLTRGPVPVSANGSLNFKLAPDFVSVVGSHGKIVGYAPRDDVVPPTGDTSIRATSSSVIIPVYGADLTTLVGHIYPGVGFVPLGHPANSSSCSSETTYTNVGASVTIPCPSTMESLPTVVGEFLPTVAAQLSGLGLNLSIVYIHSQSIPKGHVVAMSPPAGSEVPARSVVVLDSSIGPDSFLTSTGR